MRRHMERMRGRGGSGTIPPCRGKATFRQRREVITVNQIMQGTRMVRLGREHFLKNRSSLQLPGVILVSRKDCGGFVQGESIEDRRLRVLRVPEVRPFHRLLIREDPCSVIARSPVLVIRLDRPDIIPLSLCLSAYDRGSFKGLPAMLERRRIRGTDERIGAQADRNAPVSH